MSTRKELLERISVNVTNMQTLLSDRFLSVPEIINSIEINSLIKTQLELIDIYLDELLKMEPPQV